MNRLIIAIVWVGALVLAVGDARGQCAPQWLPTGDPAPGAIGLVNAMTPWDPDGPGPQAPYLVAGGVFAQADGVSTGHVIGIRGHAHTNFASGVDGPIQALAQYGNDLIAGGSFSNAGGHPAAGLARWNGSQWSEFGGANGTVHAMTVFNGELIVAGNFTVIGGQAAWNIIRWDGASWHALGAGLDAPAFCLWIHNGELIAGGAFLSAGGQPAPHIAAWNGASWRSLGSGIATGGVVNSLCSMGSDLIAAGQFSHAGGNPAANIAAWDGAAWSAVGTLDLTTVSAVASYRGSLYAAGDITGTSNRFRRWNGAVWENPSSVNLINGAAYCLLELDGVLNVGGVFTTAGYAPNSRALVCWDGDRWHAVGTGTDGVVQSLAEYGGEVVAAGSFTLIGGTRVNGLARWNGQSWRGFAGPGPLEGSASALLNYKGSLYVAGYFSSIDGTPANNVARWDGAQWHALGDGVSAAGISCMTAYHGNIYANGLFLFANGGWVWNVLKWDGQTWSAINPLGPLLGTDAGVERSLVYQDKLYFAASFPAGTLARWDDDAWEMVPDLGAGPLRLCIHNGDLYGTNFGSSGYRVGRFDGSAWSQVGSLPNDGALFAIASHNGELFAGGTFGATSGPRRIARWDGAAWNELGSGADSQVRTLLSRSNELWVGGSFTTVNGQLSSRIARWACSCYANCDNSSQPPILTANDFQCFLNQFAAGAASANCDGSSATPILTANDFQCFLNKFAAGCP